MKISKKDIDSLNSVVTIDIKAEDYQIKVDQELNNYRRKANIPGFRKGHVPMSLVKKQYGKSVMIDEVNKLIQESLNNFLIEEKLDVLGNPLPKPQEDFTWEKDLAIHPRLRPLPPPLLKHLLALLSDDREGGEHFEGLE